jgi:5-methylthioribose kinase
MEYTPLNPQSVIDYLKSRPMLREILSDFDHLVAQEVGDGNLNQVFIIRHESDPKQAIIVKQALPYLRVAGDSWPLTRERVRFETQALRLYNEVTPGLAPQVYDYDEAMSMVAMEYLGQHEVMRKPLVARQRLPHFADHISTFMAATLFYTSDLYKTGLEKKLLQAQFINPHLNKIQEDFVYTNPYMQSPENRWNPELEAEVEAVRTNSRLKLAIAEMKDQYMTRGQALIHSDLHTGSIMVNADDTRVIDPEFAFFGPMGFDIGALFANLVLNALSHFAHTPDMQTRVEYQSYLVDLIHEIWTQFAQKFERLWVEHNRGELVPNDYWQYPGGDAAFSQFRQRYLHDMLQDAAGHGACEILRRMMGIVSVSDIQSIADLKQRAVVERSAVRVGLRWVMERSSINGIEDLIGIVTEEIKVT